MTKLKPVVSLLSAVICMSLSTPTFAADTNQALPAPQADAPPPQTTTVNNSEHLSMAEAAKKSANPVSDIWMFVVQNDYTSLESEDGHHEMKNRLSIQPVMPVPILDNEYNIVNRVVFQQYSSPGSGFGSTTPDDMFMDDRTNGLGDTILLSIFAPNRDDGIIWGVGPTVIAPTASDDYLGQEKWQVGPAALVARLGASNSGSVFDVENWNLGILAQQWWSVGGDDDRADTSQSDIQYFLNYKINDTSLIGMTPDITIDWKKEGKDRFNVPIGLGYIGIFKVGPMPVRWGAEIQYYVMHSDPDKMDRSNEQDFTPYAPDWNFKFFIIPIIANPLK